MLPFPLQFLEYAKKYFAALFKLEVHHFAHKLDWISQILYDNLRMPLIQGIRLFEVSEMSCILVFSEITPTVSHFPNLVFIFILAAILVPMNRIS